MELTRRLLTSISSLPNGTARPRAVLNTVIFVTEYGSTPWEDGTDKTLRLACWNADGVRGRKLELEHFLSQHGVDIRLLSETFLNAGQAFRLASYVCQGTDRPTAGGGGTAILVNRVIVHHSVPVSGLTHLEATTIQVIMVGRTVKILAAYLSSRPLIGADLTACFGGGLPVLMAGNLNAKHVD